MPETRYTVHAVCGERETALCADAGENLLTLLQKHGFLLPSACGGNGTCKKCGVTVNGKRVFACRTSVNEALRVELPAPQEAIKTADRFVHTEKLSLPGEAVLALDLGTTTLALALASPVSGTVLEVVTADNPQRVFGADVMARIAACRTVGQPMLQQRLTDTLNGLIDELLDRHGVTKAASLTVAGNTVMLHLLFGADCSGIGTAPYTPSFLKEKAENAASLGIRRVGIVRSFRSVHSFFGGDLTAGLCTLPMPKQGEYALLMDLGTNAEIALVSPEKILCTSAAAGPCFEGAGISCGMPAINGAVSAFRFENGAGVPTVIGGGEARGLCGTGLIDAVSALLEQYIIDDTGCFAEGDAFEIAAGVFLTQADIRAFQTAKSAIQSAVTVLLERAGICFTAVERLYLSGGFSAFIRVESAVRTGLVPGELAEKATAAGNTSLAGAVLGACKGTEISHALPPAEYVDLTTDAHFSELFIQNMFFD